LTINCKYSNSENKETGLNVFACTKGVLSILGTYVNYIGSAIRRDSSNPLSILALSFIGLFGVLIICGLLVMLSPILIPMVLLEAMGFKICR
jgi:sorbitol-specific phosphotransferase system component IIBC